VKSLHGGRVVRALPRFARRPIGIGRADEGGGEDVQRLQLFWIFLILASLQPVL
jgi:hypothetical protein